MELIPLLEQFGFSEKEAKVYLSCLELGQAPVSSIARNVQEQRVTTYSILKNLVARGVAQTFVKNRSTFYSVIPPEKLLQNWETRCEKFKEKLPEFLALTEKFDTHKPKVQFYDGLEGLKYSYEHMVMEAETMPEHDYFMIFLWTADVDPRFQKYLMNEFVPRRQKYKKPAKAIISKKSSNGSYSDYNKQQWEHIIVDDTLFDIADEIVLYGQDRILIAMYTTEELSSLVITSRTLYKGLKSAFDMIWKMYKKK